MKLTEISELFLYDDFFSLMENNEDMIQHFTQFKIININNCPII